MNVYDEFRRNFPTVKIRQKRPTHTQAGKTDLTRSGVSDDFGPFWVEWYTQFPDDIVRTEKSYLKLLLKHPGIGVIEIAGERDEAANFPTMMANLRAAAMGFAACVYCALGTTDPSTDTMPVLNDFTTPSRTSLADLLRWAFPGAEPKADKRETDIGPFTAHAQYGKPMYLRLRYGSVTTLVEAPCPNQMAAYQTLVMIRAWLLHAADSIVQACQTPPAIEFEVAVPAVQVDEWD